MSGTYKGNARGAGFLAERSKFVDAVGLSPAEFQVVVAVMSYERAFGQHPTVLQVRQFLDVRDICLRQLVGGRWLSTEGKLGARVVSARPRAWATLGFPREEAAAE